MVRYQGVHHLAFATRSMEETVRFWRDLLGMRLVYTHGVPGNRQYFFEIAPASYLSFFEWPRAEPLPLRRHGEPVAGPFGFDHLALAVADEETLWEVAERLLGAERPLSSVMDHGFIRSLYSFDPNGLPIEFTVTAAGVTPPWESPRFRERVPLAVALEGSAPVAGHWPEPDAIPPDQREVLRGEGWEDFLAPD